MIDYSKTSRNDFNAAAKNEEKTPTGGPNPKSSETNKDNAAPRFDTPSHGRNPAPNLAPPGMSGNKGGGSTPPTPDEWEVEFVPEGYEEEPQIDIANSPELIDGRFDNGVEFLVKQEDQLSPQNLEGGRISRLTLIEHGQATVHYDGEWERPAQSKEQSAAVEILKERFNGIDRNEFRSFKDVDPSPDDGFDP